MNDEPQKLVEVRRQHWQNTYTVHPGMYGEEPSAPAAHAAQVFRTAGAKNVLVPGAGCRVPGAGCRVPGAGCRVPGAGHGRDALPFAREESAVQATDFSPVGPEQLQQAAKVQGVTR